jgi:hypothetical protein
MRIVAALSLIACALAALPARAEPPAGAFAVYRPYNALLQKTCPDKRLYYLSPGDLSGLIEDFTGSLTRHERMRLAAAYDGKRSCAHVIAGATCGNVAMLRAAERTHLLARFAGMVCRKAPACRAQSDCG